VRFECCGELSEVIRYGAATHGYRGGGERVCDHLDVSLNSKHASGMRWQMNVLLKMAIASAVKRASFT
jgi:hypothetical protein